MVITSLQCIFTDHLAVQAILDKPESNGKHARWWLKVFGSGINNLKVVHRPGRENLGADALSRNPVTDTFNSMDIEAVVLNINSLQQADITTLLYTPPSVNIPEGDFHLEQRKDPRLKVLTDYLEIGMLPSGRQEARGVAARALNFTIVDKVLYLLDGRPLNRKRAVVPSHLQQEVFHNYYSGWMAGHFSGIQLYIA